MNIFSNAFSRRLSLALLAALLSLGGTVTAGENRLPPVFSRYETPPVADSAVVRDRQVVRSTAVRIDRQLLTAPQADATAQQSLLLNLFDDAQFVAELDRVERSARGVVWIGHLRGIELSQVVMVVSGEIVSGNITLPAGRYHVRFMGNGVHEVQKIDSSLFPEDESHVPVPNLLGESLPPPELPAGTQADDGSLIDVMVVYTATARAAAGGTAAMQSLIDLAVSETNQAYQNSGVTQRIRLVHSVEAAYTETVTDPLGDALDCITSTSDGCLDNIHALRDTYAADLVSFWLESGGGYCGLGWMQATVSASFASNGFSTVARSCATGYYSFGHELGHNMGARHDVYVDPASTPYSYAHGYTYTAASSPWRTIMAYNNACSAVGKNCTRIPYWSNPSLTYGGVSMGNATANNRTTLNNTAYTVANFRTAAAKKKARTPPLMLLLE